MRQRSSRQRTQREMSDVSGNALARAVFSRKGHCYVIIENGRLAGDFLRLAIAFAFLIGERSVGG